MEDVEEISGTSTQLETSRQLEISPTLLLTLRSWNLGQLHLWNPILSPRKCILVDRSPEVPSPRNSRKQSLNLVWTEQFSNVRLQPKPHLTPTSTKTPTNFSS
jgi:hypothetical protein